MNRTGWGQRPVDRHGFLAALGPGTPLLDMLHFIPTTTRERACMPVKWCDHSDEIKEVTPSALGCEECLKTGDRWLHLRLCRTCGHVGCCDSSPNRHATAHFHATGHPIIEGYDPPEGWGWCYIDEDFVKIGSPTPQRGPIKRW